MLPDDDVRSCLGEHRKKLFASLKFNSLPGADQGRWKLHYMQGSSLSVCLLFRGEKQNLANPFGSCENIFSPFCIIESRLVGRVDLTLGRGQRFNHRTARKQTTREADLFTEEKALDWKFKI